MMITAIEYDMTSMILKTFSQKHFTILDFPQIGAILDGFFPEIHAFCRNYLIANSR